MLLFCAGVFVCFSVTVATNPREFIPRTVLNIGNSFDFISNVCLVFMVLFRINYVTVIDAIN